MRRTALAGLAGGLALLSMTACSPLYGGLAGQTQDQDGTTISNLEERFLGRPNPARTPELDSLILFGSGLLGTGGLVYVRGRWRRR